MVAVPTLITAEVFTPARIVGSASGSSIAAGLSRRQAQRGAGLHQAARHLDEAGVGVAHDRQQRIEEQRDQRRPHADVPVSGIRNASSASDGMVWIMPVATQHRLRDAAASSPRACRAARRSATASASEPKTSTRCSASRRPKSGPNSAASKPRPRACAFAAEELARHLGERHLVELGARVEPDHRGARRSSLRARRALPMPRKALRHVARGTAARRRTAGKKRRSSSSTTSAIALDLRVGRVEVDHVDLARGERLVGEAVVESARRLRQPVGALAGPASRRGGRGTRARGRSAARVPRQIGERADAERSAPCARMPSA